MASRKRDTRKKKGRADRYRGKAKKCWFTENAVVAIDYKDVDLLRRFVSERGKISPRRNTGTSPKMQRALATAVKRARHLALLPFVKEYYR
jgi:small subunit ribosomal protein S18